ncbi:putative orfan [Tupanvirus soda lake]|uniref:Orfan n=1 Tax=Tupanvirus deep ocean TaxID=2126984 RepID=A0A2K9L355_9VIRU|nr:putative orfan [Tupanvirus soda lake]AUL77645.2 putative orfan [Tupanvirus soda lake]
MQADNRPYFFVHIASSGAWSFIAQNCAYQSNMIPIEKIEVNGKSFTIVRVVYTKEKASEMIKNAGSVFVFSETTYKPVLYGPDLYALIDNQNNKTISTVWKPAIQALEIQYDGSFEKISEMSTFRTIRGKLVAHLEKTYNGKAQSTSVSNYNDHIFNF